MSKKTKFILNGKEIKLKEECEKRNLSYQTVTKRLRSGVPLEEALVKSLYFRRKIYFLHGKRINLAEVCREKKLTYRAVIQRIKEGWSVEEALEKPTRNNVQRKLSLKKICENENVSYHVVKNLIYVKKISAEVAIKLAKKKIDP